ncbi:hypothetical protein [Novosphingobium sp. FSW06-99]|uniref:hypothetical protein n=1 Tax=Novosphingobium sp. FSW06-99 TaxID=1739113 RepID=UPI00076CBFFC|nr:hypothetical protein [Novosphingobium sp. FSW06-99]KUR80922.1 hypothetical protein AQZ49_02545 [Novosphingobium sp. FSW06-99]
MEFLPVFYARHGNQPGQIALQHPTDKPVALTEEAPDGFDGAPLFYAPPVYPAMLITALGNWRHVPNTVVRSEQDWLAYHAAFFARKVWAYANDATDEAIAQNDANRRANKARAAEVTA